MKPIIKFLIFSMLAVSCLTFSGCYLATQGYHAVKYQLSARPVEKVLSDPSTPDSIRSFLLLTRRIHAFAVDSLGLHNDRNYTTLVNLDTKYLVDVVCACAPDTFRTFTWNYPVVGRVPYKGFFKRADAEQEAARLKQKGLDVLVRGAGAYSSLGIVSDPLYSFMSRYSLFDIASLLIHEQTHATIYLKNHADFNEQMAVFTGEEGALKFIASAYGDTSEQYRRAVGEKRDGEVFMHQIRALRDSLAQIYSSGEPSQDRIGRKNQMIGRWKSDLLQRRDSLFVTDQYKRGFERAEVNNAYLTDYMTYYADLDIFYRLYEKNGRNLLKIIEVLKKLKKAKGDPKEIVVRMIGR